LEYTADLKYVYFNRKNNSYRIICMRIYVHFVYLLLLFHDKWVPVTTAWRVLRVQMEERPPDMEGSCEYFEEAVADSRQGAVLQLGDWARC
jgi:hypothetical protein